MVAYATPDDVRVVVARDLFRQASTAQTAAAMDDDQLEGHIENAQAEVDSKLSTRYPGPFDDPVPPIVKWITVDIAAWLATLTFHQEEDELLAGSPIQVRYLRAEALLKCIQDGDADIETADGEDVPITEGAFGRPIQPGGGVLFHPYNFGLGCPPVWSCY